VIALFGVIVAKVADLQVLNPSRYVAVSTAQTLRSQTLPAERGAVYDRNHQPLALSVPDKAVFADPKLVRDPFAEAAKLGPVLGLTPSVLEAKLRVKTRFVYLARRVTPDLAAKVHALGLPGIDLLDEPGVAMAGGPMMSSLLGAVDVDNKGLSGLEGQYDHLLTGTPGQLTLDQNPQGRTIPIGEHRLVPAVKGHDLVLTVDQSMQYQTEQILAQAVANAHAKGGVAIVSRPSTGDILAMANVSYDPTTKQVVSTSNNAAVTTVYEPGSVMKVATVSAALEHHLVTPDTKIDVPATYKVADGVFTDAEQHATEQLTVAQVVAESSNIGTIKLAQQLGKTNVYQTLRSFGFGSSTPLRFPNEAAGYVLTPPQWSGTSIATMPIGQGISATPLQVLEAYNVVANDGMYIGPRLVSATVDPDGHAHATPAEPGRRVLSTATARTMNQLLRGVVDPGGTGALAKVDGYPVFGKTGTAREPQPNGRYTDAAGNYHYAATFVGVVPAGAPALSVIVVIDDPKGNYFGGSVAAPAFSKIASYGLRLFRVPPPPSDTPGRPGSSDNGVDGPVVTAPGGKIRAAPSPASPPSTVGTTTTTRAP
jgi:cell division protein FtsI (penicillin-binding protein 3)